MSSREKREQELLFLADEDDWVEMKRARVLTQKLNTMDRSDFAGINAVVRQLLGKADEGTFINPPFYCDYGTNIEVGRNFFANYNCVILDNAKVVFGDNCMLAPNVSVYTAGHTLYPTLRGKGYEYGIGITVGDNVWIGGNVVLCPGVHIGSNSVIGAGSVVTRDIPEWSLAAGNPCRVIRQITEADKPFYFRDRRIGDDLAALLDEDER